ncbi:sugar transferase [Tropicimonas sp. IMCC6043]|uniref:sugar transferase n=1 Tax=Tropicimonas sp. IMCC6043 TaxID=2510645 RepID=UPI00101D9F31|nr:sugar transferase [Tropicimonas sp. IMCC6043]RYH10998.1 sugar transferase [Tropicimonas sp. IMCC6043]
MTYISEFSGDFSPKDAVALTADTIPPQSIYTRYGKRALDVSLILIFSPFILALVLAAAFAIRLEGGSVFFVQKRLGKDGRVFPLLKLRTMVENAEERLEAYLAENPEARVEWETNQKLRNDPRITRVGNILRRTSLDELPQMWNVLTGDMSLVGPRPMTVEQGPLYPGRTYYLVRPGISGPWQVSDRHESAFTARAIFDAVYVREMSFSNDLRILVRTVTVVLRCTGL